MASHLGSYAAQQFIAALFRGDTVTFPATLYAAALTTAPTAADNTGAVEVSGNNYARVAIAAGHTNWSAGVLQGDSLTTLTQLQVAALFPTPSGTQGPIVAIAFMDASTNGHLWAWYTFSGFSAPSGIPYEVPTTFTFSMGG